MAAKRSALAWFLSGMVSGLGISLIAVSVLAPALLGKKEHEKSETWSEISEPEARAPRKAGGGSSREPGNAEKAAPSGQSDSLKVATYNDSIEARPAEHRVVEGEEIVIAQDELIHKAVLSVSNDSIIAGDQDLNIDSLLIDDWNRYPKTEAFQVEFWSSPINYRGYRLQNGKLVLFGVDHFEDASLWRIREDLYLRYHEKYYPLRESPEFRQLVSVNVKGKHE